jgi:hypothetical protein
LGEIAIPFVWNNYKYMYSIEMLNMNYIENGNGGNGMVKKPPLPQAEFCADDFLNIFCSKFHK